ncbi:MAG: mechanosensitive ion channel family protein [Candidatus Sumerlaeota bacterium]
MKRLSAFFLCFVFLAAIATAQEAEPTTKTVTLSSGKITTKTTVVYHGDDVTTQSTKTNTPDPLAIFQDFDKAVEEMQAKIRSIDPLQWAQAIGAILLGLIFQRFLLMFMRYLSKKKKDHEPRHFRQVLFCSVRSPLGWLPVAVGISLAGWSLGLDIGTVAEPTLFRSFIIALLVFLFTWLAYNLVDVVTYLLHNFAKRTDTTLDDDLVPLIHKTMKVAALIMGVVTLGGYVGGPFKGILAGVGLGGLAVALAARDTLANFFGYVVLFLDRPFAVGERIEVNGVFGDVEDVGLRSTKIRTLDHTLVSIPNSFVANESIENFTKRQSRKVDIVVGVTYDTNADQMEKFVEDLREIFENTEGVEANNWCLGFTEFGGSSLDIQIRYYTTDIRLPGNISTRQRVNLAIMRKVEEHGLSIAFPTRTLYLQQDPDGRPLFPQRNGDSEANKE